MSGYQTYLTAKNCMARNVRKHLRGKVSRKQKIKMRGPNWTDELVRDFFRVKGAHNTLDAAVFLDEYGWEQNGLALFPESNELLEMLWRSKMNIEEDSLDDFPSSFIVSWPNEAKLNGFDLPPVLVNWVSFNDRATVFDGFRDKYLSPMSERVTEPGRNLDEKNLHLTYSLPNAGPGGERMFYRCSVPRDWVKRILTDSQVLSDVGAYDMQYLMMEKLKPEELELQWTLARTVLHLLVYTQACPESLVSGWPDQVKEKNFMGRYSPKIEPTVICSPTIKRGPGVSPDAHWRNSHFRSFPKRKDGTRKKGIVFVAGCLVNAEIEPKTVLKVT